MKKKEENRDYAQSDSALTMGLTSSSGVVGIIAIRLLLCPPIALELPPPMTPSPFKMSSFDICSLPLAMADTSLAFSLTPSAVNSPVIVLFRCHDGIAFCCRFISAWASLSWRCVISSLSIAIITPTPSSSFLAPSAPAIFSPGPEEDVLLLSDSIVLFFIQAATSKLNDARISTTESKDNDKWHTEVEPLLHSFVIPP